MKTTSTTQPTDRPTDPTSVYLLIEELVTNEQISSFQVDSARTIYILFNRLSTYYPNTPASDLLAHIITGLNMLATIQPAETNRKNFIVQIETLSKQDGFSLTHTIIIDAPANTPTTALMDMAHEHLHVTPFEEIQEYTIIPDSATVSL